MLPIIDENGRTPPFFLATSQLLKENEDEDADAGATAASIASAATSNLSSAFPPAVSTSLAALPAVAATYHATPAHMKGRPAPPPVAVPANPVSYAALKAQQTGFESPLTTLRSFQGNDRGSILAQQQQPSSPAAAAEEDEDLFNVNAVRAAGNNAAAKRTNLSRAETSSATAATSKLTPAQRIASYTRRAQNAAVAIAASPADDEKTNTVKRHLRECGLSEELVDLLRPTITREQMTAMWNHIAGMPPGASTSTQTHSKAHDNVMLDVDQAKAMARWLYSRIPILFRNMLHQLHPTLPKRELNALCVEHLPHLLPATADEIVEYFVTHLQFNADGKIGKDDFVRVWNRQARLVLPSSHHKSTDRGTVYCTIL